MRIDRLDLTAYGPFTDKSLNLSEGPQSLHLIYGDNEAGKSTSLRALIAWLFTIPARTSDDHVHSKQQLRIGGKLRLSSGEALEFIRRKGNKDTLLAPGTDDVLDDSVLTPYVSGASDETLFRKLYGIDHGGLVAGGEELLNQSGDLGQALFSAAIGSGSLHEILSDLQGGAEALFKPSGRNQVVNQAIAGFRDARRQIRESSLPVAEWNRLQKELAAILADIKQIDDSIDVKSKEKSRLDRLNRVKGALAERSGLVARKEELGDVLLLPEDFDEKHREASRKLSDGTEAKTKAEARLSRLKDESGKVKVSDELLENEEAILAIYRELGAVEKTITDRPQQDGKRRLLRNEAEQLLKGVRSDIGIDDCEQLRPLTNNRRWISDLAQQRGLLNQDKENTGTSLRKAEDTKGTIRKELAELADPNLDLSELKAVVAAGRKAGDMEQRLAESQQRASKETSACQSEFSRLGRFGGTMEELAKIAMPVQETLDRHDRQFEQLTLTIRDHDQSRQKLQEERKQVEQELKVLLLAGDVPTTSDLEEARSARNGGWDLVKRKYIEGLEVEQDSEKLGVDTDLPAAYEQQIDVADDVSDRMRLAADQVAKRADLEARIEDLKSRHDGMVEEAGKANEDLKADQTAWNSIWKPLGIDPGSPREMKQWLLRVDNLLTILQSARTASADAKKLAEDCEPLKEALALQISRFDDSTEQQGRSLEAMMSLAEQRISKEDAALERKRQLQRSLDETNVGINDLREKLKSVEKAQAKWAEEWRQAIDGLGLKPDVHPEQAMATFEQLMSFFDRFDESEELRKRIYGMDQVTQNFEKNVIGFVTGISFSTDGQDANAIAAQLNRDLNESRGARERLQEIKSQGKEITDEVADVEITMRTAKDQLASLREQAKVETDEELESVSENSRKMREIQQKIGDLDQELTRNGDGLSVQELAQEAGEADLDTIDAELERVSGDLGEMQEDRDELRDRRRTLQDEINGKDGSAAAADASESAAEHLATMVSGAEQYLRLQISALMLKQQIEDYRKKNQAPVLVRAGEFFSRLTLGSYASLRDELDERGKPVLLAVRPDDVEVAVDGMSDGTRDQLYLSLRLATLEQHLSVGESMPFVVDDILISFDDKRTKACLSVLAELALSTQVLLFTHHRRVFELAAGLDLKEEIRTHELG